MSSFCWTVFHVPLCGGCFIHHGCLSRRRMAPVPWALPRFWGTHGYGSEFQRVLKTQYGFGSGKCSFCIGSTPCVCTHGVDNGGHEVGSTTGKCADCSQPFATSGRRQAAQSGGGIGAVPKRDQGAVEGALSRRFARVSRVQHAAVLPRRALLRSPGSLGAERHRNDSTGLCINQVTAARRQRHLAVCAATIRCASTAASTAATRAALAWVALAFSTRKLRRFHKELDVFERGELRLLSQFVTAAIDVANPCIAGEISARTSGQGLIHDRTLSDVAPRLAPEQRAVCAERFNKHGRVTVPIACEKTLEGEVSCALVQLAIG
eukprot:scaffold13561_cov108-Phaeocystis_antarctica.AAC.4